MEEAFDTLLARKAQEAEDAVLAALRAEVRTMGEGTLELLRQRLGEQGKALDSLGVKVTGLHKEVTETRTEVRAELNRLGSELWNALQKGHKDSKQQREGVAADQKAHLESLGVGIGKVLRQLETHTTTLAAQERKLSGLQDSLRNGLGALGNQLPEQFHRRTELKAIFDEWRAEQRSLFEASAKATKRQIRIAQLLGGLAALLSLVAWLAPRFGW